MSKHRSTHAATASAQKPQPGALLHAVLLGVLVALCVARPLLPSEAVAWLGDGQPFNMLVLCLAVVTCLTAVGQGGLKARWTATDGAVLLLCGWYATSAMRAAAYASPRPALNMLWEWTALGFVYFLVRQLVRTGAERRAFITIMIALAVVLSSYGYYQYFVSMPADRAEYARDPDAMLRRNDMRYAPGSVERQQFESRLRSTEPLATFALTNSLAGYLAPWLLVAVGIGAGAWLAKRISAADSRQSQAGDTRRTLLTLAAVVLLVGGCLVLTKSRSAYLASALGLLLLPLTLPAVRGRVRWRLAVGAMLVVALLVGGAIAVRGLDRAVLSEAGKSLGYRLEYWQSTLAMIRDQPWFGCGPGNFQDAYMRYKLPQASEEIQDPHNLFFEVWATAGTPALLALLAVLGSFFWRTWKHAEPEQNTVGDEQLAARNSDRHRRRVRPSACSWPILSARWSAWISTARRPGPRWRSARWCCLDCGLGFARDGCPSRLRRWPSWCWSSICWRPEELVFPASPTVCGFSWRWRSTRPRERSLRARIYTTRRRAW